jgi:hypothetical protein
MVWFGNSQMGSTPGLGEFTAEDRDLLIETSQGVYRKHLIFNYQGQAIFTVGLGLIALYGISKWKGF